jgi:hypothetical protein
MSILSDIPFIGKLIDDYGEKLVVKGIEKITGVDISKEELTNEDKQKILDSQIEIMKIDFEKLKLDTESKLQSKKMIFDDKSNARGREVEVTKSTGKRDYALIALAVVIVIGFFAGLVCLVFVTLDKGSGTYELLYMMFGALITKFGTVVDYFFGSSDK